MKYTIYWLRRDLRLEDNACLQKAINLGLPVIFLYIYDQGANIGASNKWWLYKSLKSFEKNLLDKLQGKLILLKGNPKNIIANLISKFSIENLVYSCGFGDYELEVESELNALQDKINLFKINNSLLMDYDNLKYNGDKFYKVFTPFYKNFILKNIESIQKSKYLIDDLVCVNNLEIKSDNLDDWNILLNEQSLKKNFQWDVGENSALSKWNHFLSKKIISYEANRDFPFKDGISKLSPHIAFGEIAVWRIFWDATDLFKGLESSVNCFLKQIAWREFSYCLLKHNPSLQKKNFNTKFDHFEWENNKDFLEKWKKGLTGYSIIDAGMKELVQTGWMHNRVRMIAGSFLVKNLLNDWRLGEEYFWDNLLDADLANNSISWQWVAGSGVDAAPYFRIFNPILQGKKFDPDGIYVKKYIPELIDLPNNFIHEPWLVNGYIEPIIDIPSSRLKALDTYKKIK